MKPGSKDDVDAIGNRDIGGGRGLGNWYSLETEIRMGREYAQMIDTTVKLVHGPGHYRIRQPDWTKYRTEF